MSKIELLNGNCLDFLDKFPEKSIIVSDPPFNIGYHYNKYSDKLDENEYLNILSQIFSYRPSVVIHYPEELYKLSFEMGFFPEKVIAWVYNSNNQRQHRDIAFFNIKPDFEKIKQPYKNLNDKRIQKRIKEGKCGARLYDWWYINQVKNVSKEKTSHPCQMPLKVMLNIISLLPDDYIYIDPFMGSGTTGVACRILDRDFIGIEVDEKYFNISKQRIENKYVQEKIEESELNKFLLF